MDWNRLSRTLSIVFLSVVIILSLGFVAWNLGGEKLVFRYGYGEPIKIWNISSKEWNGKQKYIKKQLEELIAVSRELGIFDEDMLPIRVIVRNLSKKGIIAGASRWRFASNIFLDTYYLKEADSDEYVRLSLVHEFSHLLNPYVENDHGPEWRKTCKTLFSQMEHLWQEEQDFKKPYLMWPDPCAG